MKLSNGSRWTFRIVPTFSGGRSLYGNLRPLNGYFVRTDPYFRSESFWRTRIRNSNEKLPKPIPKCEFPTPKWKFPWNRYLKAVRKYATTPNNEFARKRLLNRICKKTIPKCELSLPCNTRGPCSEETNLRQGVCNLGAESGVSGRTRLLPGTLAHALVVLHNALPTGHETSHNGWTHWGEDVGRWLSVFEALLRRYSTVSEAFLRPRIAT